jgi:phosphopantetheine--protein transferase-like protein
MGIDIERVERFRSELRSSNRFISRAFTDREVRYCMSKADPPRHFAGTFAAKEAANKAVCALITRSIPTLNFEVTHRRNGVPEVTYTGKNPKARTVEIRVSISHSTEDAVAVALALLPG